MGTLPVSFTFHSQSLAYSKLCGMFVGRMNVTVALENLEFRQVETWEGGSVFWARRGHRRSRGAEEGRPEAWAGVRRMARLEGGFL